MENVYIFVANLFMKLNQISSESPEFYTRYYTKHFGLFLSGHTVYSHRVTIHGKTMHKTKWQVGSSGLYLIFMPLVTNWQWQWKNAMFCNEQ